MKRFRKSLVVCFLLFSTVLVLPASAAAASRLDEIAQAIAAITSLLNQLVKAVGEISGKSQLAQLSASLSSGLVGHWTFDEGNGGSAGDSSGSGRTGTLTNGPS